MGWTKFVATQNFYSIASRDIEREIVPMALSEGIGIMPWSPLAGGFLSGKFTRERAIAGESRRDTFDFPPINKEKAYDIIEVMIRIGKKHKASAARVALSWMLTKPGVTSIIIGAKKMDQLIDNIECTGLKLSNEELGNWKQLSALSSGIPGMDGQQADDGKVPGGDQVKNQDFPDFT